MKVFVGCASRNTDVEEYNDLAKKIANYIVKGNHSYVFGGCNNGLMGVSYKIVNSSDGSTIAEGVKAYEDEITSLIANSSNPNLKTNIHNTVNERTNAVFKNSDVIIFITGGIGSIYELMSAIETKRAGEHNNPIFIINVNGYYDNLIRMLEKTYKEGFASLSNKEVYNICYSFEELERKLNVIQSNLI